MGPVVLGIALLVTLAASFVVLQRRARVRPPPTELLYVELAGEQRVGLGHLDCRLSGETLRVSAVGEGVHFELELTGSEVRGHLLFGDRRALLGGEPLALDLDLDRGDRVVEVHGLRIPVVLALPSPCSTRFVREVDLLVATSGPAGRRLVEELTVPPPPDLPTIPWTLDSASRFSARELAGLDGVHDVEIIGPGLLRVLYADGNEGRLHLDNLMPDLLASPPSEGRERLLGHLKGLVEARQTVELTADQILVRVYPGPSPLEVHLADGESVRFASAAVADDLTAVLVQDLPTAMRPLREQELPAGDPDGRLERALGNVLASLDEVRVLGERPPYQLCCGGDYENVLPLLPEVWTALRPLLSGPVLVALPARDICLVTPDEGPLSVALLQARMLEMPTLAYPLSDGVYRLLDGRMVRVS